MIDINPLSIDELIALNHRVVERLKFLEKAQAHVDMMAYNLGARVSFETVEGRRFGRLTKYNRKTVTVITEEGQQWRIPPHLISPVKDITPEKKPGYNRKRNKRKQLKRK
jgi:hypothetical protein